MGCRLRHLAHADVALQAAYEHGKGTQSSRSVRPAGSVMCAAQKVRNCRNARSGRRGDLRRHSWAKDFIELHARRNDKSPVSLPLHYCPFRWCSGAARSQTSRLYFRGNADWYAHLCLHGCQLHGKYASPSHKSSRDQASKKRSPPSPDAESSRLLPASPETTRHGHDGGRSLGAIAYERHPHCSDA